jgi:diketogulonate reductase-like aldo/keto reductase
MENQLIK